MQYKSLLLVALFSGVWGCSGSTEPEMPPFEQTPSNAWFFAEWDSALTNGHLVDSSLDGKHKITIDRRANDSGWVIDMAERLYPTRDFLQQSLWHEELPEEIDSLPDSASVWWQIRLHGICQPFAVTAAAVQYYCDLSHTFRDGDYSETGGDYVYWTVLNYTASSSVWNTFVTADTTYFWVWVAELNLEFNRKIAGWGSGRREWTTAYRIVVFDGERNVLAIIGDGDATMAGDL